MHVLISLKAELMSRGLFPATRIVDHTFLAHPRRFTRSEKLPLDNIHS